MAAFVHTALLLYVAAACVYLTWLVKPGPRLVVIGRVLLALGVLAHIGSFAVAFASGTSVAGLPTAAGGAAWWRGGQLFSLLSAVTVVAYLLIDLRYKIPVAGAFVAPLTVAAMVPAHLVPTKARAIAPELMHSVVLPVHIVTAALGTAALALSFALAILYLAGERQLKQKKMGAIFARLPSLDLIDRLGWGLSVWGFIFLSVVLATGSLAAMESTGGLVPFAVKEGFAVLAWGLFAALIQARLVAGWRGRRVALLVVAGFLLLVGSYAGLLGAGTRFGVDRPAASRLGTDLEAGRAS